MKTVDYTLELWHDEDDKHFLTLYQPDGSEKQSEVPEFMLAQLPMMVEMMESM